jgi:hypothetical protein
MKPVARFLGFRPSRGNVKSCLRFRCRTQRVASFICPRISRRCPLRLLQRRNLHKPILPLWRPPLTLLRAWGRHCSARSNVSNQSRSVQLGGTVRFDSRSDSNIFNPLNPFSSSPLLPSSWPRSPRLISLEMVAFLDLSMICTPARKSARTGRWSDVWSGARA